MRAYLLATHVGIAGKMTSALVTGGVVLLGQRIDRGRGDAGQSTPETPESGLFRGSMQEWIREQLRSPLPGSVSQRYPSLPIRYQSFRCP